MALACFASAAAIANAVRIAAAALPKSTIIKIPLRILISGASGFVGAPLSFHLSAQGHEIIPIVRSPIKNPKAIVWAPERGFIKRELLEGFDAVIHLAGEPLSLGRWGHRKKDKIFHSRVDSTQFFASLLSSLNRPPKIFISASAIGIYGNRGEELLDESSSVGTGFLPSVCKAWEDASRFLEGYGIRTVRTRFGIVLGKNGGILQKLIPLYKWGLGATLGSGSQWISWIALEDLIHAFDHILQSDIRDVINFVSPNSVRQEVFSTLLARLMHRPSAFKIPASVLRFILGEMADEMLLSSTHAVPLKLLQSGFSFKYPMIRDVLQKAINS